MALEARYVRSVLDGFQTQLTTQLPTSIDDIVTDGGLEPADPTGVDIEPNIVPEYRVTRVRITLGGPPQEHHWMTPQVDLEIPILLIAIIHHSDNHETNHRFAWELARALDNAMHTAWPNVTGIWLYRGQQPDVVPFDPKNPHRLASMIQGTAWLRTQRIGT